MAYFVYYNDNFHECGGVGFETFGMMSDALDYINKRMIDAHHEKPVYRLIEGREIKLEPKEKITVLGPKQE